MKQVSINIKILSIQITLAPLSAYRKIDKKLEKNLQSQKGVL